MADDSKTEKASPKKRKDERKKGNVFQSKDIVSVASVVVIFALISLWFPTIYENLAKTITTFIGNIPTTSEITSELLSKFAADLIVTFLIIVMPIALVAVFIGIVAAGAQTRFLMSFESLKPKFERIDPIKGFQKMFSMRSLVEMGKAIIKIAVVGYIIYNFISSRLIEYSKLMDMSLLQSISYALQTISSMVFNICVIFVFVAALDFIYQWWDYEKNIKMSKHDVKEEYKQLEGDPQIKGKIKERQRKMSMSRMIQAVPSADVVIRNPTHFAVALKYDIEKDSAPIVVALGQDRIAFKIIEVAQENNVHVIENKPLARAIFATAQLNREIPPEYFAAVAEILALVYTMNNKAEGLFDKKENKARD